jgi:SAM-dependent methyltransferase
VLDPLRYEVDLKALGAYAGRFRALAADDAATRAWLEQVGAKPHSWFTTWWVNQLSRVVSVYDAHGMTGSYAMHLLSTDQWRALVGSGKRLLDVGAGAGYVTAHAEPLFEQIVCTETSRALAKRLRKRGLGVHAHDLLETPLAGEARFDVIACLNVLDRTPKPHSLLAHLRTLLAPAARLLVAVPLPVRAHVHVPGATISPAEPLPASERTFEGALCELSAFFEASGFSIERIARAPYLSRGDTGAPLYALDDALWVLKRA